MLYVRIAPLGSILGYFIWQKHTFCKRAISLSRIGWNFVKHLSGLDPKANKFGFSGPKVSLWGWVTNYAGLPKKLLHIQAATYIYTITTCQDHVFSLLMRLFFNMWQEKRNCCTNLFFFFLKRNSYIGSTLLISMAKFEFVSSSVLTSMTHHWPLSELVVVNEKQGMTIFQILCS